MSKNRIRIWIIAIIILGFMLRFYGLNWGSPFYFHPDERNIAGSISRMYFEKTINPHFFAYGSFWSYIVLFFINATDFLYKTASPQLLSFIESVLPKDPFSRAIVFLRILSALQGIGTIIISYFVGKIIIHKFQIPISKFQTISNFKFQISRLQLPFAIANGGQANFKLLILPFLIATSPGLIQASHFGTFESSLTFLYFLIFYLCLTIYVGARRPPANVSPHLPASANVQALQAGAMRAGAVPLRNYLIAVIIFGISISIKVTSLVLFPVLLLLLFVETRPSKVAGRNVASRLQVLRKTHYNASLQKIYIVSRFIFSLSVLIFVSIFIFILSNPYSFNFSFLSNGAMKQWSHVIGIFSSDFLSTMNYESSVAQGTMQVFYTQQFQNTQPIVYQFVKILPYVLNPLVYLLFIFSLLYFVFVIARSISDEAIFWKNTPGRLLHFIRNDGRGKLFCFTFVFFLLIFFPNSVLYVKWTRYIIPSLPYIYIFVFLFLLRFSKFSLIVPISLISLVFSLFFTSVYSFDTRIEASAWAKNNLKPSSRIISEIYDMGIVPYNEVFHYSQIRLFNFYDLDDKNLDVQELQELQEMAGQADVVVLPSRRIIDTRLRLKAKYPNGVWFYTNLINGNFGFRLAKSFSHPFDKIIPGLSPDESFTVFDHPEVMIFVK